MPKLNLNSRSLVYYISLPRSVVEAIGWVNGDRIRFTHVIHSCFRLQKDVVDSPLSMKLCWIPASSVYRLIVPAALVDFFDWYGGKWLMLVSYSQSKGLRIDPQPYKYDRAIDRKHNERLAETIAYKKARAEAHERFLRQREIHREKVKDAKLKYLKLMAAIYKSKAEAHRHRLASGSY